MNQRANKHAQCGHDIHNRGESHPRNSHLLTSKTGGTSVSTPQPPPNPKHRHRAPSQGHPTGTHHHLRKQAR